jgi:hypothetical protein
MDEVCSESAPRHSSCASPAPRGRVAAVSMAVLMLGLQALAALAASTMSNEVLSTACSFEIHNASGCTAGGHYAALKTSAPDECCAHCSSQPQCNAWSFHAAGTDCFLATSPKLAHNTGTADTTCGCKHAGCVGGPPAPVPPSGKCEPVQRPPKPTTIPLPAGKTRPHIVTILVDDLGFADASIRADHQSFSQCPGAGCVTPHLQALRKEGILMDRHHTFLWCSPTRRSFLTGRYPVHVTGTQAPTCSNLTPLQFTTLSEKLAAADYESYFVGKGHLGYWTTGQSAHETKQRLSFLKTTPDLLSIQAWVSTMR